jgi:hypothetical protein
MSAKIKSIEKIYSKIEPPIVEKKILTSIEKETSLIGKELLICDQLQAIKHKYPEKQSKNLLIFYVMRLSKYNEQVIKSLNKELEGEKNLLKRRVSRVLIEKDVQKELYKNILKAADKHYTSGKGHLSQFDGKDENTYHHASLAHHHKERAEDLYSALLDKNLIKVLQHLAFVKLGNIYSQIIGKASELSSILELTAKTVTKGKQVDVKIHEVHRLVAEQNLYLRHFAINYSKSLVHAAEFMDESESKVILYKHK